MEDALFWALMCAAFCVISIVLLAAYINLLDRHQKLIADYKLLRHIYNSAQNGKPPLS